MKRKFERLEDGTIPELRFDITTVENSLSRLSNSSEDGLKKAKERIDEELRKLGTDIKCKSKPTHINPYYSQFRPDREQ